MIIQKLSPKEITTNITGHVDNVDIYRWLNEQRMSLFSCLGFSHENHCFPTSAKTEIDFSHEIFGGSDIEIYSEVSRIGNSSFSIRQKIQQKERVCVESFTEAVNLDYKNGKSTIIKDKIRDKMESQMSRQ